MAKVGFLINKKSDYDALMIELEGLDFRWNNSCLPTKFDALKNNRHITVYAYTGKLDRTLKFVSTSANSPEANMFKEGMKLERKGDLIKIKEDKHSKLMCKIQEMEDKLAELKKEAVDSLKEEKKYCVVLPDPNREDGERNTVLWKRPDVVITQIVNFDISYFMKNSQYHLTELEIKANHDWAWQFAKEVD